MQVGSATFIIRVIKHSGNSASCKLFPGCQDISRDISFLLPLSPYSYCSIFYQLLITYISHHQQQQSPPQNHIHTTPPQNHKSYIHRILLQYIVSIIHNTTITYIISYCSKSYIITNIILLLPLFKQNLTKIKYIQILQTNNNQLFKETYPYK